MRLIDTHCHLDVEEFDSDRAAVLVRSRRAGVAAMVVPGVDAAGWDGLLTLCRAEPDLFPALGLHPIYLSRHTPSHVARLEALVATERLTAIGEIGLDYYVEDADRPAQQTLFEAQLAIASAARLPVLLHVRKAHDAVLATLRRFPGVTGIAHAFAGSLQQARQYIDRGFRLGFGGVMTFERAHKIRRLAKELPIESIVLETDAPDLPPAFHAGERNTPEYLHEILHVLAFLRQEEPAVIARRTSENALAVLPALRSGLVDLDANLRK